MYFRLTKQKRWFFFKRRTYVFRRLIYIFSCYFVKHIAIRQTFLTNKIYMYIINYQMKLYTLFAISICHDLYINIIQFLINIEIIHASLSQGFRYYKLLKTFTKFFHIYTDFDLKFGCTIENWKAHFCDFSTLALHKILFFSDCL